MAYIWHNSHMHFQSSPDVDVLSSGLSLVSLLSIHASDLYTLKVIVLNYITMLLGWECSAMKMNAGPFYQISD